MDREYLNLCAAFESVLEADGASVDQDQIDFWMRHAARFDHVFHRGFFGQISLDTAFRSGEKV